MDYSNREPIFQEDISKTNGYVFERKMDQLTLLQLENFLQQQFGVCVPAIVLEYISVNLGKDTLSFDYEDLHDVLILLINNNSFLAILVILIH